MWPRGKQSSCGILMTSWSGSSANRTRAVSPRLKERLGQFELELHPARPDSSSLAGCDGGPPGTSNGDRRPSISLDSRIIAGRRGTGNSDWGASRAKRVTRTLNRIKADLRKRMHEDVHETARWLGQVVNGWLNYFAVPTSSSAARGFVRRLSWICECPAKTVTEGSNHDRRYRARLPHCIGHSSRSGTLGRRSVLP